MLIHSGFSRAAVLFLLAAVPFELLAVDTHVWEQSDQSDFSAGTPKNISIRSDGHLTLSPQFKELDSTGVPYLWAVAQDSKGALYYAGGAPTGATTKIFVLRPHGKSRVFAEVSGLEIHALAIDSQDRVYAAVVPDAKVYRIDKSGKPAIFFDPKCKYIWAMVFDHSGNLYIGTGDSGIVYRVTPQGKSSAFIRTDETHARSMIIDRSGNLIIGTEPGGLILRVTPAGKSFVLYQADKREVTAVAEHDGIIYAAAVGTRPASVTGPAPILPSNPSPVSPSGIAHVGNVPPILPPAVGSLAATVSGGSDLYRIEQDGFAQRIWSSLDIVYAIAFDRTGRPLLATGNRGIIYRIDSDQMSTELLNTPPTQVTALLDARDGVIYAATGNVGDLYAIGPGRETQGTLESDVLDVTDFAYWGKMHLTSTLHGGSISVETRSGNLNRPQNDWSSWSKVDVTELGGQVQSPPARFLQYRVTLHRSPEGESPELSAVDIAYLPRNIAPQVHEIDIAPVNYREPPSSSSLERMIMPSGAPTTLSVPAVGQKRSPPSPVPAEGPAPAATLQYSKGFITVRWSASDPNGDPLVFKLEIKGKDESFWRTLKDNLQDRFYAFDSAAFPDGHYRVRVTASDAPANTPATALKASLTSDPFTIDNTPPQLLNEKTECAGATCHVSFTAKDALSWIDKAEYAIDGGEWVLFNPVNKVADSQVLDYRLEVTGRHMVAVRVFDENDNVVVKQFAIE